ncbi:MFS transporter [Isoptericola sp. G70]|uniref:MFS transporter n=1 Tax=Isoptericola sp. G70 TaxID=3376633 RepID=UPI003A7F7C42
MPGWRVLVAAVLLASLSQVAAYVIVPAIPLVSVGGGAVNGESLVAVYLTVVAVMQLVWGPVSDRLGRRRTAALGIAVGLAGTVVCATSATVAVLLTGRLLQAVGFSSCLVGSRAVVRDASAPDHLPRALAVTTVWIAVIPAVTPVLGGLLAAGYGWRAPFVLTAVLAGAVLVAVLLLLAADGPPTAQPLPALRTLTADRALLLGSVAAAFHFGALSALTVGMPRLVERAAGLDAAGIGALISAMTPMFILGAVLARSRPGRVQARPVRWAIAGQIACAAGGAVAVAAGGRWLGAALACCALYCIAQGALLPALTSRAIGDARSGSGVASSVFGAVQLLGGGAGAGLVAWVGSGAVWGVGAVMVAALTGAFLAVRT